MTIRFSVGDWNKGAKNLPQDVKSIQSLLTQLSILAKNKAFDPKGVDGKIAKPPKKSNTVKAIIAFQATIMHTPDGLIEPRRNTHKKILSALTRNQFPKRPNFAPLRQAGRENLFGKFKWDPPRDNKGGIIQGGNIILKDDWAKNNLVTIEVPYLGSIPIRGGGSTGRMTFHKAVSNQLRRTWQTWHDADMIKCIQNYSGAYVPRLVRRSSTRLSSHAWGTAFDINSDTNPLGRIPPMVGDNGCVRELVQIANAFGFYWGGHFSRPDGMHFEAAIIGAAPCPIA